MVLIAVIIGFAFGALLFRKRIPAGAGAPAVGPAEKSVKATIDGQPVRSYVAED